jgi:glyoxylase-like metal-dependent hydrolase (beta-lactamase superfamily II)
MMSVLERAWAASPVIAGFVTCLPANDCAGSESETLHLDVFIGAADSLDVTSALIYGKSEAILVDCQFRISEAKKLADQVAARGRRLKAIIITHPDNDHYIGTARGWRHQGSSGRRSQAREQLPVDSLAARGDRR